MGSTFLRCGIAVLAILSSACVDLPGAHRFACEQGGPCTDAGLEEVDAWFAFEAAEEDAGAPRDASSLDASSPRDAGRDSGQPRDSGVTDSGMTSTDGGDSMNCGMVRPLPTNGLAYGETLATEPDRLRTRNCYQEAGGPEHVYSLELTVPVEQLIVRTLPHGEYFDTVVALYEGSCRPSSELACDDDGALEAPLSQLVFGPLEPGTYFVSVDAYAAEWGDYALEVFGELGLEAPCDPESTLLRCRSGTCASDDGQTYFCRR